MWKAYPCSKKEGKSGGNLPDLWSESHSPDLSKIVSSEIINIRKNPAKQDSQTVDKVPGLHRGFSIAVINISMILPVFIKKNSLLINSKVKRRVPCTWYNYPIRRFRL